MNNDFFENLEKGTDDNNTTNEAYENVLNGTEKNINYFLMLAKVIKVIAFILAVIVFTIGIIGSQEDTAIFITCLFASIALVVIALLSTPFLEWKAYTLKNIYEINKSMNNKK